MDVKTLRECFGGALPPEVEAHYINERRAKRYSSIVRPDKFDEELEHAGIKSKPKRKLIQACCEAMLENVEREMHKRPRLYAEMAERVVPQLRSKFDFNAESYQLESTAVGDIAAFRNFSFGIVREIWPMLAPIAEMLSVQSMPGPSERLFYVKTYGDDDGTFYTADWRLVNQVDTDYDEYTCGSEPNEVSFTITGAQVDALAYALLGRWDLCAEQDAQSQHGFDINAEAPALFAQTIARAKWNRIRDNLIGSASGGTVAWSTSATASSEYTLDSAGPKRWQRTLYDAVLDVDRLVFDKVYTPIDWVVVSSDVATRMLKTNDHQFVAAEDHYRGEIQTVTEFYGTLDGRVAVWRDPDAADNTCLCGVSPKGKLARTGYLIGEYVPFRVTDRFMDPADLSPRRAGITRYAEKLVNGAFYGKVAIS